jgi:hypothetical protein
MGLQLRLSDTEESHPAPGCAAVMRPHAPCHNVCNVGIECGPAEPEPNLIKNITVREEATEQQQCRFEAPIKQCMAAAPARHGAALLTDDRAEKPDQPDKAPKQTAVNEQEKRRYAAARVAEADDHEDKPRAAENNDGNREEARQFILRFHGPRAKTTDTSSPLRSEGRVDRHQGAPLTTAVCSPPVGCDSFSYLGSPGSVKIEARHDGLTNTGGVLE